MPGECSTIKLHFRSHFAPPSQVREYLPIQVHGEAIEIDILVSALVFELGSLLNLELVTTRLVD